MSKLRSFVLLFVLVSILRPIKPSWGQSTTALKILDPAVRAENLDEVVALPLLNPTSIVHTKVPVTTEISAPFPVAKIENAADLADILRVYTAESDGVKPDELSIKVTASLIYDMKDGSQILVTTASLSPAMAEMTLLLGDQQVTLSNGKQAWTKQNVPSEFKSSLVFVHDNLLITVAGDKSVEILQELALQVTVQ